MKFSEVIGVSIIVLIQFFAKIECSLLGGLTHFVSGLITNGVLPIVESPTTLAFRRMTTVNTGKKLLNSGGFNVFQLNSFQLNIFLCQDEFITYYNYLAEEHHVITDDGYNLTVFRCNSNKPFAGVKRVVLLLHCVTCSSDEFTMDLPHQALGIFF